MKVNYKDLLDGYILRNEDELLIHGIKFCVHDPLGLKRGWFLARKRTTSDIFRILNITNKYDFAKSIATLTNRPDVTFPEMETAEDLTKLVIALYEKSPYKVGDKVKLVENLQDKAWVEDEMLKFAGRIVTIDDIQDCTDNGDERINGDPHRYVFKETEYFVWPSTTFTPVYIDDSADASTDHDVKTDNPEERMITKKDLENGYILQLYDKLCFKDLKYQVRGFNGSYYLGCYPYPGVNSTVFYKYLSDIDRERVAKSFGSNRVSATDASFPEFPDLDSLSAFVLHIMRLLDNDLKYCPLNAKADPSDVPVVHSGDEIKINPYYTNNIKTTIKL